MTAAEGQPAQLTGGQIEDKVMDSAQWLIVLVGIVVAMATGLLLRRLQLRRRPYQRLGPSSQVQAVFGSMLMLALFLFLAWLQGELG